MHRVNHYPADSAVCFFNTYPLDSDLGPSYMVSGTRDNPSPEVTLSNVYM